ncbi:MAG TPA: thioredoxin [Pyrinomonadaceae bacterium]|nr:thioredoxin [Pyrinomonadaceae bacterium]
MSELVREIQGGDFEQEVLNATEPVLVDFWAAWCPPCRMIQPTLETLAHEYEGTARIVKVDVDSEQALSQRYGIKALPTLVLFKGGKEEERIVGAANKETFSRLIDRYIAAAKTAA